MNEVVSLQIDAPRLSHIVLLCYLFLLLPGMLLGFYFARRKMFVPHHKLTMTGVVIFNWVLIGILMFGSYRDGVLPYLTAQLIGDVRVALPTLHAITGGLAQLLATYLALRMWFEKVLPRWIMVKNIKRYMRLTLALWIITVVLGCLIYLTWYLRSNTTNPNAVSPAATVEPGATTEPGAELLPGATAEPDGELTPGATAEVGEENPVFPAVTPELTILNPAGVSPVNTPEVAVTPEVLPGSTPEVDDNAARDAARATEDAIDDAQDASEDAARDAARATEDAQDAAEDAAKDAAKATEDAAKKNKKDD